MWLLRRGPTRISFSTSTDLAIQSLESLPGIVQTAWNSFTVLGPRCGTKEYRVGLQFKAAKMYHWCLDAQATRNARRKSAFGGQTWLGEREQKQKDLARAVWRRPRAHSQAFPRAGARRARARGTREGARRARARRPCTCRCLDAQLTRGTLASDGQLTRGHVPVEPRLALCLEFVKRPQTYTSTTITVMPPP